MAIRSVASDDGSYDSQIMVKAKWPKVKKVQQGSFDVSKLKKKRKRTKMTKDVGDDSRRSLVTPPIVVSDEDIVKNETDPESPLSQGSVTHNAVEGEEVLMPEDEELQRAALVLQRLNQGGRHTLALPQDENHLNSLHCFVRSQLLEFTSCKRPSKKRKTDAERVGLQCVYCAHQSSQVDDSQEGLNKVGGAAFFPKSVDEVYRSVCTWQRTHFATCPNVPFNVKDQYMYLKQHDKSRGKTKYWTAAAHMLGLQDIPACGNVTDQESANGESPRLGIYFAPMPLSS